MTTTDDAPVLLVPKSVRWAKKCGGFIHASKGPILPAYQFTCGGGKHSGDCGRSGRRKRRIWNLALKNR